MIPRRTYSKEIKYKSTKLKILRLEQMTLNINPAGRHLGTRRNQF